MKWCIETALTIWSLTWLKSFMSFPTSGSCVICITNLIRSTIAVVIVSVAVVVSIIPIATIGIIAIVASVSSNVISLVIIWRGYWRLSTWGIRKVTNSDSIAWWHFGLGIVEQDFMVNKMIMKFIERHYLT